MPSRRLVVSYFKCEAMRAPQTFRLREGQCRTLSSHGLRFRVDGGNLVVENLRRRIGPWDRGATVAPSTWESVDAGPTSVFRIGCHSTLRAGRGFRVFCVQQDGINIASRAESESGGHVSRW